MRKRLAPLCCLLALLTLTACQADSVGVIRSDDGPTVVISNAAPTPAPVTPEPAPEPEPEPEPEPATVDAAALTFLSPVTMLGRQLPGGSVTISNRPYIRLREAADVLDGQVSLSGETVTLRWGKQVLTIQATTGAWQLGDRTGTLTGPVYQCDGELLCPMALLTDVLELAHTTNLARDTHYFYPATNWEIPSGYTVPVLMYHGVSDDTWGSAELFVRPSDLEEELKYLQENGFTPIWFTDLHRVDEIEKPVILTFDDGYLDNYTELFPLLKKYNTKATVFVITGNLGYNKNFMTWEQAKEMADSGLVAIESHTVTHPHLNAISREQQIDELQGSYEAILEHIGRPPSVICYPFGSFNADAQDIARGFYACGIMMNGGDYTTGTDTFVIPRWYVPRYTTLGTFAYMAQ